MSRPLRAVVAVVVAAAAGLGVVSVGGPDRHPAVAAAGNPDAVAAFVGWEPGTAERLRLSFEGVVARCMEAKDLPYSAPEPAPRHTGGVFGVPLGLFGAPDRRVLEDYQRLFGYGIASQFDELRQARADNARVYRDPNAAHLAGLAPARQAAWAGGLDECRQRADRALNPDPAVLDRMEDAYGDMEERLAGDPRSRELERRWARCLNQRGFPFSSTEEIRRHLLPQLAEVAGDSGRLTDAGFVLGVRALDSDGDHRGDEFAGLDSGALERLRAVEMAIARADLDCRQRLRPDADALRAGYENEFVTDHHADLKVVRDRWRDR